MTIRQIQSFTQKLVLFSNGKCFKHYGLIFGFSEHAENIFWIALLYRKIGRKIDFHQKST